MAVLAALFAGHPFLMPQPGDNEILRAHICHTYTFKFSRTRLYKSGLSDFLAKHQHQRPQCSPHALLVNVRTYKLYVTRYHQICLNRGKTIPTPCGLPDYFAQIWTPFFDHGVGSFYPPSKPSLPWTDDRNCWSQSSILEARFYSTPNHRSRPCALCQAYATPSYRSLQKYLTHSCEST